MESKTMWNDEVVLRILNFMHSATGYALSSKMT